MTIIVAVGDRSGNTCKDLSLTQSRACGVTFMASNEVEAIRNQIFQFSGNNNRREKKNSYDNVGYHHGTRGGH